MLFLPELQAGGGGGGEFGSLGGLFSASEVAGLGGVWRSIAVSIEIENWLVLREYEFVCQEMEIGSLIVSKDDGVIQLPKVTVWVPNGRFRGLKWGEKS